MLETFEVPTEIVAEAWIWVLLFQNSVAYTAPLRTESDGVLAASERTKCVSAVQIFPAPDKIHSPIASTVNPVQVDLGVGEHLSVGFVTLPVIEPPAADAGAAPRKAAISAAVSEIATRCGRTGWRRDMEGSPDMRQNDTERIASISQGCPGFLKVHSDGRTRSIVRRPRAAGQARAILVQPVQPRSAISSRSRATHGVALGERVQQPTNARRPC